MGFDNECILNIQSLAGEYFCPVCRLLVYPNEALQSQCTHLYCKPCLAYVVSTTRACPYDGYLVTEADSKPLTESNKALAETIGKIAVHCLYHRSGCQWQGPLSECISHCTSCAFGNSPVVCNRCGVQIVHRQVQEHAQNCPGVQSQTQQVEGVQDAAAQGVAVAAADQSQTAAQAGAVASQSQPAQITPASAPVQDPNQQVNSSAQAAAPTPEQWYQHQQQYQQYYQQYPGYDPYQQHYQQYYPYQQQPVQYQHPHMQPLPAQLPAQTQSQSQPQPQAQAQPQPLVQSQPQTQPQPQPQSQSQSQPQHQPHLQPQPQPQNQLQSQPQVQAQPQPQPQSQPLFQAHGQAQTQTQPQPHSLVQVPVAVQPQNQVANQQAQNLPVAQQPSQIQAQTHPPFHGHQHPQTVLYPQAQSHPQPHSVQPRPQQHQQMPQYQQPHPPMQHVQSQIQRQPNSQLLPQHHPLPQPQPQPLPQTQQPTLQPHPQPHPHALSQQHPPQPNQAPNPNPQSQTQPPSAHAVTGHHSFPQPRPQQQIPLGALQQQPVHMHPQAQYPQQSPQMRPPQPHAQSQQQPALLPLPGQAQNVLPPQQLPVHPHQQAGHPVHQRVAMQPIQQPLPHQLVQQTPSGASQNQLHQQGTFMQPPTPAMQSQLRPQAPPQSWQQQSHAYPQPQQKVGMLHGVQPHQPQNVGRPVMPNQGVQQQPFPQSQGGFTGAGQLRPMHLGPQQPYANQMLGQHLEQSAYPQPGLNVKQTTFEKPGDDLSKKGVGGQDVESFSEKTARDDANGVAATSGIESNAVEIKSETDLKSIDDKQKTSGEDGDTISRIDNSARSLGTDPVQQASENGEPVIKQIVKEEVFRSTVERSPGGKSIVVVVEDQKNDLSVPPKQVDPVDHSLMQDKENQKGLLLKNPSIQQAEIDEKGGKLQKDSGDASGVMQPFTVTNRGTDAVLQAPVPDSSAQNATPKGSVSMNDRKTSNQPGNQEKNLLQGPAMLQGPSNDEYRGFPPPSQVQGRGCVPPLHPVPILDVGRHQPPAVPYGPTVQQRPVVPSGVQAMLPPGLVHNAPMPAQPSTQLQPQAPGLLPHPIQQSHGSFHHEIPPSGILGPGSAASFGRGLSHFGPPQRSFELPSLVSQGHYNQGHGLPSHAGPSRISQGETIGRPPLGSLPPGSFDSHGGMMVRAPLHGPEGQQRPVNPAEAEIFPNSRPNYFDGRQSDSHIPGSSERGPFGQPSGIQSNMMRMNGGPGIDSSLPVGLRDERFKSLPDPFRGSSDHGKFSEDLKQFPRSSHLDSDVVPKYGNYFSSSRPLDRGSQGFAIDAAQGPLDKAPLGFNYDPGFKSIAATGTSRFFPPPHPAGDGERPRLVGFHDDNVGRSDLPRTHPKFLGSVPEYGRHHMDGLNLRSPTREFSGIPPRGFGGLPGGPGRQSDLDDIDGRESRRFGEGSKTFNLPSDESRFPVLPSHLRRGELEGPGELVMNDPIASRPPHHLRGGDLIGPDIFPSHLQRGEHFGSRNMPGQLRFGEPVFDAFLGHPRMGDLSGPGNFPSRLSAGESFGGSHKSGHPRIGEPGFRSTYSLHGYPNDHGFRPGEMESFDNLRKRKPQSTAWCRICNIDCETVDGLELHSQTREHQQMAMDIVLSIKQKNAKKQKLTSKENSTPEDSSKSKKGVLRGGGISIKP